jgi:hypothetical protein
MRLEGLRAIQPRSFKPNTIDSKHGLPVCANLLQNGANAAVRPGEVFVGDITYLRLADGSFKRIIRNDKSIFCSILTQQKLYEFTKVNRFLFRLFNILNLMSNITGNIIFPIKREVYFCLLRNFL